MRESPPRLPSGDRGLYIHEVVVEEGVEEEWVGLVQFGGVWWGGVRLGAGGGEGRRGGGGVGTEVRSGEVS